MVEHAARVAASYVKRSQVQQNIGMKMIDKASINKGDSVLDLGCGTGYLTKVLSERVGPEGKVVAVDPDGERLKLARENYPANNIEYIQADDKTFPLGIYDLVFANQAIHWVGNKEAVLKRVYENLRPGGQFAFTTVDTVRSQVPSEELPQIPRKEVDTMKQLLGPNAVSAITGEGGMKFLSISEYENLSIATNYSKALIDTDDQQHEWSTVDEYLDTIYGWFHGIIDPSNLDQDVIQRFKREHEQMGGPFLRMHRTYLYIIFTK